jgi:metal-responsive CopG/Arc/MetJ family transcriptional regulator
MRTLIDIPTRQIEALSVICNKQKLSRSEAVRQAIAAYIQSKKAETGDSAFGLWKKKKDGVAYQKKLRAEW